MAGALADLRAAVGRRPGRRRAAGGPRPAARRPAAGGAARLRRGREVPRRVRGVLPRAGPRRGDGRGSARLLDAERQRREANYLLVLGRGREGQGRVAEALAAYARLYPRADHRFGIWRGPDVGWLAPAGAVPPRAGAALGRRAGSRGSVIGLVAGAAGGRGAVDREVARQWRDSPAGADLDELGRFVELFGTVAPVGMEARLAYAERLAHTRFLEAELHLLALQRQREAPQVAARALEALARLLTEKGLPDEALCYYRQLAEEFATDSDPRRQDGGRLPEGAGARPAFPAAAGRPVGGAQIQDHRGAQPVPAARQPRSAWSGGRGAARPCAASGWRSTPTAAS